MIFLTGFMGTGKTTIGRELANLTGEPFIDMDEEIVKRTGSEIPEIFKYASEAAFRTIETEVLFEIAEKGEGVVATGGGVPVKTLNRQVMNASGMVVNLTSSLDILKARVCDARTRPMWTEKVEELFKSRNEVYKHSDLVVDTGKANPQEAAKIILEKSGLIPENVPVLIQTQPYPVYIGRGIFKNIGNLLRRHLKPEGLFAVVDEKVLKLYRDGIGIALAGFDSIVHVVPCGEGSKSFSFLGEILSSMISSGINRNWACIAVGGGVTGDLGGFAASIFMRGIPLIQVPTTLLAQADAGIGGKTGINHVLGKNLIGAFHQPTFVVCDCSFLDTLEEVDMKGGMSEVLKYGIIMDEGLFKYLENGECDLQHIVKKCCRDKAYVVSRDEREGSLRRILNFGHTLGHAIEKHHDFMIHHGESVAMGMDFACFLSSELGLLKTENLLRIKKVLNESGVISGKYRLPPPDDMAQAIAHDKKSVRGGIHFVLAKGIGSCEVREMKLDSILDSYERYYSGY